MRYKVNLNSVREINTSFIMETLKEHAPISKYDISKITKLSAPAVSNIINNLIKIGFVKKVGIGESIGGRPPEFLALNSEYGFIIGVDVGIDNIASIVVDYMGNMISKSVTAMDAQYNEFIAFEKIIATITDSMQKSGKERSKFIGMGIGISGDIDPIKGVVVKASRLKWEGVPLKSIIEKSFHIPTIVDENVRLLTIAEKWFGAGKGYSNIVCIRIGDDIGAGIMLDDKLYGGHYGKAGANIGHIVVDPNGTKCECGNRGCLQTIITSKSIISRTKALLVKYNKSILIDYVNGNIDDITVELITKAAVDGDKACLEIMQESGRYLAIAILNIINCLNPEQIIIGGGVACADDILLGPLKDYISNTCFKDFSRRISRSFLASDAYAIGAATNMLHKIYAEPGKFISSK